MSGQKLEAFSITLQKKNSAQDPDPLDPQHVGFLDQGEKYQSRTAKKNITLENLIFKLLKNEDYQNFSYY